MKGKGWDYIGRGRQKTGSLATTGGGETPFFKCQKHTGSIVSPDTCRGTERQ